MRHLMLVLLIVVSVSAVRAQELTPQGKDIQSLATQMKMLNVAIDYAVCERDWHPFLHKIYWQESDGRHYIDVPEPWEPFLRWTHADPCKAAMREGGACEWKIDDKDWPKARKKLGCPLTKKKKATMVVLVKQ